MVEDDSAIRWPVELALRGEGYVVEACSDGQALESVAGAFRPDLVLLDVRLPVGPDGYSMARTLRGMGDQPILFLTAADAEGARRATRGGHVLDLTRTEYELLVALAHHPGQVLSKVQLLTQVWDFDAYDTTLVEVQVRPLRRKLESRGPRLIHTVRGMGYTLRV